MGNAANSNPTSSDAPFSARDDDYNPISESDSTFGKCSWKTRIIGFIVCCTVGWLISLLGTLILCIKHDTTKFAILFSIGQTINIGGSCFLATPKKQYKSMVKKSRIVFSAVYIATIILTLVLGLLLPENLSWIVIVSLIAELIAYFLYTITYIPGGLKAIKKICKFI